MNHWIEHASSDFAWEFFAIFDCDMVPHPFFIQEMLPAMLTITAEPGSAPGSPTRLRVSQDRGVAFIATRQVFGDVPPLDPLGHRQDMMYETWEPAIDATDQALFLGTNAIFSREAVNSVGNFPVNCLTEDTLICLKLHTAGYRGCYYPRTFTRGLAPDTIRAAFRQRCRWAHGNLQILWRYNPMWNRKLDWRMRTVFSTVLLVNVSGFPLLFLLGFTMCAHPGAQAPCRGVGGGGRGVDRASCLPWSCGVLLGARSGVQTGFISVPELPVALGLLKLGIWGLQYVLLFSTSHVDPTRPRPILAVWRQTQMALCFTMCGVNVIIEESIKEIRRALCNIQHVAVFKPTIDTTRVEVVWPPELVQAKMGIFLIAVAFILRQW